MKNIVTILLLVIIISNVQAQSLNVHKTDGSIINVELSDIDSITFDIDRFNFFDDFNRTEIGNNWITRFGEWSIEDNKLKHTGDGTFHSNFVVLKTPVELNHYSIECEIMWISGGFFEDGVAVGYKIWDTPASDGRYYDDFIMSVLSSYSNDKAAMTKFDRDGTVYSTISLGAKNLDTNLKTNFWYMFKIEVLHLSGSTFNVKLSINDTMYLDVETNFDGNQIALGCWKGQYGQQSYFDNFRITDLGN